MLIVAPWKTDFWERNFFVEHLPAIEAIVENVFVRGAVSGVGAVTALAGLAELAAMFGGRNGRTEPESRVADAAPRVADPGK